MMRSFVLLLIGMTSGLLPAYAADSACGQTGTTLKPIVATHTIPPYPTMSQRLGEEGTTTLRVEIGADGVLTNATVARSSGSLRLDDAAREFVLANWKWQPPTQNCKAVAAATLVAIKWDLKEPPDMSYIAMPMLIADYPPGAAEKFEQGNTGIVLLIGSNGSILHANVTGSSGFPDLDAKALDIVQNRHQWAPGQMDGKPVPTAISISVRWRIPEATAPLRPPAPVPQQ